MRKFTAEERERIHEQLIQTGRELLVTYGPSKTTVKDITEPVGIAKPTFYQFFDAKSDLYVEIFERELDEFAENMRSDLEGTGDPQDRLERFFRCYAEFGEENEFVQQVFLRGDYRDVIGDLSSEQIADLERKELEVMVPPIEEIQRRSDGPISEMEPLIVLGIMGSSLGLLVLHKDEFDEYAAEFEADTTDLGEYMADFEERQGGVYSHLRDVLITTLARGLTVEDERE